MLQKTKTNGEKCMVNILTPWTTMWSHIFSRIFARHWKSNCLFFVNRSKDLQHMSKIFGNHFQRLMVRRFFLVFFAAYVYIGLFHKVLHVPNGWWCVDRILIKQNKTKWKKQTNKENTALQDLTNAHKVIAHSYYCFCLFWVMASGDF